MTVSQGPGVGVSPGSRARAAPRSGAIGLAATGVSVALTATVALLGPSIMEPSLPGAPGQPPWALAAHPSPYLAVALTAAAILTGVTGLSFSFYAIRRGWRIRPGLVLLAGIAVAMVLAFLPPFGSSDHLSYAAYGRMAITGHNPYTTTPAALARLGDPVARAVQDWRDSPSVYGSLAVGVQAFAAWIGAGSVRLTVFVLSLVNAAAFAATGVLLHWLGRGDEGRQRRAAVAWTANPLLLMVLVAGAHIDTLAIVFGVAAVAVAVSGLRISGDGALGRQALIAAGAGALIGLGFAVKVTTALAGAGLAIGVLLAWRSRAARPSAHRAGGAGPRPEPAPAAQPAWLPSWRWPAAVLGGLAAGFGVVVAASLLPWGTAMFGPALNAGSFTSIGSPWRPLRSGLELVISDGVAEDLIKAGAVVLAAAVLIGLLRQVSRASAQGRPGLGSLLAACAFAVVFAWLLAWPYVLPWYDGLGWALLALLPASRLDWLLLARTAGLAIGYLPARGHIAVPAGLTWLETVVRTAVTPLILLAVIIMTIAWLWPARRPAAVAL